MVAKFLGSGSMLLAKSEIVAVFNNPPGLTFELGSHQQNARFFVRTPPASLKAAQEDTKQML
jgi:hypothetical protein